MNRPSFDEDQPLDPAVQRLQARVRGLLLIAGLTLGVGLLAVFGAILYRIATLDSTGAVPFSVALSAADLGLAPGMTLQSSVVDGGRLVLTYAAADSRTVVLVDEKTGKVIGRIVLPLNP